MAWAFVVPGVAVAVVADRADAALEFDPADRVVASAGFDRPLRRLISRPQRVGGEEREDVGQKQLLMLLLVIDADLDEPGDLRVRVGALCKQSFERLVDVTAVCHDALGRRPCQQTAVGARLAGAERLVIRIEAIIERRIELAITT